MKKLLYILLFAFVSASTITACTEEEIKPVASDSNGGAGVFDPK